LTLKRKRFKFSGDGKQKISFTSLTDIGSFVAETINHPLFTVADVPATIRIRPNMYYISVSGVNVTVNEVLETYKKVKGVEFKVEHVTIEDQEKLISQGNPFELFGNLLRVVQAKGHGLVIHPANNQFPSVKPIGFEQLFQNQ
jgi:nucleoside-diphosphate-sugar epimerase